MEKLIWDAITNKAKTRFDYSAFSKSFPISDESVSDDLLFKIIVLLAMKEPKKIIALKLFNEILLLGLVWEATDIEEFLQDKDKVFKIEIYAAQLASDLLQDGNDPLSVLNSVNQFLN
jgi:hypothetical protein